jgi:hypothetical protein
MENIPDLIIPEVQPDIQIFGNKGEKYKFFETHKKIVEMPMNIWAVFKGLENEKALRHMRVNINAKVSRFRSTYFYKNIAKKGILIETSTVKNEDGTYDLWIRKMKKIE